MIRIVILFQEFSNNSFYLAHECVQAWKRSTLLPKLKWDLLKQRDRCHGKNEVTLLPAAAMH